MKTIYEIWALACAGGVSCVDTAETEKEAIALRGRYAVDNEYVAAWYEPVVVNLPKEGV